MSSRPGTVLVVGGGGGIGRVVCQDLARHGHRVCVADLSREAADSTRSELGPGDHIAIAADIAAADEADGLVDRTTASFGRLDAVVNLAAVNRSARLMDVSASEWDRAFATNVRGALLVSRAAVRTMSRTAGGRIIHFTSLTGLYGSPGHGAYAASKAALTSLVRTMAVEWLPLNVRVNAICPVATETAMSGPLFAADPEARARFERAIPAGRLGAPADYCGAVRFLLSGDSDFIVGQTLYVDGGASIAHPLLGAR